MRKLLLSIGLTLLFFQMLNSQADWRYRLSLYGWNDDCCWSCEDDRAYFRLASDFFGLAANGRSCYGNTFFSGPYTQSQYFCHCWTGNGCGRNMFSEEIIIDYFSTCSVLNYSTGVTWLSTNGKKPTKIFMDSRGGNKLWHNINNGYSTMIAHHHNGSDEFSNDYFISTFGFLPTRLSLRTQGDDGRMSLRYFQCEPIISPFSAANTINMIAPVNQFVCSNNNAVVNARTGYSTYAWYYKTPSIVDSSFSIFFGWTYFNPWILLPNQTSSTLDANYSEFTAIHSLANGGLGNANIFFRCMVDGQPVPSLDGETSLPITFFKAAPSVSSYTSTPASCYYTQDGEANIFLSRGLESDETLVLTLFGYVDTSGNGSFVNYAISNQTYLPSQIGAGNKLTWSNLAPGNYSLKIEGTKGTTLFCDTSTYLFNITRPDPLDFSLSKTDYTCYQAHNGIIDVTATGGNGGYQYQLDNGSYQSSNQFTGVMLGNRSITVKDNKGCFRQSPLLPSPQNSKSITINQPDSLQLRLDSMRHPLGYGRWDGFIRMTALGGTTPYTYTWSNGFVGANNINLPDGLYRVDLSDAKGCSQWDTIRMIQPDPLIGDIDTLIKIKCHSDSNGSIIVHTEGGVRPYFYLWNTGHTDSVVHDLPRGIYTVTITDINGNDTTASILFGDPDTLAISEVISPASCAEKADGAIDISPSGGTMPYRYQWIFGDTTQDIINIQAGNYFITMLDSQDCKFEKSFVVRAPNALEATPELVHPTCYQGSDGHITLQTKGGTPPYSYLWTNTNSTTNMAKDLKQGTYASTVTDAQNCQFVNQTALTHPPQIELSIPRNSYTLCDGQELILDGQQLAEPNVLYEWTSDRGFQSSQQRVTLIDSAIYTLNVTNQKGCKRAASFQIYRSNAKVESIFLVASSAYNDTSIIALNIGKEYDRVAWKFPPSARVDSTSDSLAIFKLSQNGEYALGLTAFKGQCEAYTEKNILVVSRPVLIDQDSVVSTSVVDSLEVFPNPNNGQFSIKIRLFERADVNLRIVGMLSSQVMAQQLLSGESKYDVPMDITAMASGVYMLIVETKREKHLVRIVKQ